jgi:RNA polymerase sigma-70 factor, ECF subfamily
MSQAHATENKDAMDGGFQAEALVEQARNGDRQAFHRLVDHYQPEIFRMIYYRTRSRMDAEDLTQDVFLRAFKHIGRLESPRFFRSWLYRIAVNRVRDHHRTRRVKSLIGFVSMADEGFRESEVTAEAPEAPVRLEAQAFWERMGQLLDGLSRMEREAFLLRFFDELSIKEMATAMGKNESTVKTHLYRALRKVKAAAGDGEALWEAI